jgi:hypothetical protein
VPKDDDDLHGALTGAALAAGEALKDFGSLAARKALSAAKQLCAASVSYQPSYPATGFAQVRLVSEAMRSVICISLFQASQHASRMAS